jgi:hypothetical protein
MRQKYIEDCKDEMALPLQCVSNQRLHHIHLLIINWHGLHYFEIPMFVSFHLCVFTITNIN